MLLVLCFCSPKSPHSPSNELILNQSAADASLQVMFSVVLWTEIYKLWSQFFQTKITLTLLPVVQCTCCVYLWAETHYHFKLVKKAAEVKGL